LSQCKQNSDSRGRQGVRESEITLNNIHRCRRRLQSPPQRESVCVRERKNVLTIKRGREREREKFY